MSGRVMSFIVVTILFTIVYLTLLVPYIVHSNLNDAGMVIKSERISSDSLPKMIEVFARTYNQTWVLTVKQRLPLWVDRPVTEWTIALVTTTDFPPGAFVQFERPTAKLYMNWREFPVREPFDQLVVCDKVQQAGQTESYVEGLLLSSFGGGILMLSIVDYYFGPLVFILLPLIHKRRPTLWSIAMAAWAYCLEIQLYNTFAITHYNYVPTELKAVGLLFIPLAPVVILVWLFERTSTGKSVSDRIFSGRKIK